MKTREYLENTRGEINFQFGGNHFHLPKGRTFLDSWDGVPPRLVSDVATHALRGYSFFKGAEDEPESVWLLKGTQILEDEDD